MAMDQAARWQGQLVLVTGGTGALGSAVARAFLEGGAHVAVTYRTRQEFEDLRRVAAADGARLQGHQIDVTDEAQMLSLTNTLEAEFQRLDALVMAVGGYAGGAKLWETDSAVLERMVATLSAVFGGLATFLAAIGLYGVMAYTVTRRTREIGIRVALGAGRGEVMWLVMREALVLLGVGLAAGLPSAWMLTQAVKSQLYGVAPHDPAAIAAGVLLISLIALAAAWAPGRRATLIHPTEALRCE